MIYCNLKGGLGNMMFQIFAVKSLSIDKNTNCSFPNLYDLLDFLNSEKTHNPELNHSHDYLKYLSFFKNLDTSAPQYDLKVVNYPFEYSELELPTGDFVIDGFFQSEKYFLHHREQILEWCKMSSYIENIIETKYSKILSKITTSIHVRRGDYLKFSNHHTVQTLEYFNKAINLLKNDTELFIIFSDDIEWCKENFIGDNFFFVENEKDYVEMYLMSFCKNNIISNSSFSWWSAWLNENDNKKVIAPTNWFGPSLSNISDVDIIPYKWIKI